MARLDFNQMLKSCNASVRPCVCVWGLTSPQQEEQDELLKCQTSLLTTRCPPEISLNLILVFPSFCWYLKNENKIKSKRQFKKKKEFVRIIVLSSVHFSHLSVSQIFWRNKVKKFFLCFGFYSVSQIKMNMLNSLVRKCVYELWSSGKKELMQNNLSFFHLFQNVFFSCEENKNPTEYFSRWFLSNFFFLIMIFFVH